MHQGPLAASINMSFCATVSPMPFRFFGTGGSLADTGFSLTRPHLIAFANAMDTTPAMLRTVFADKGRAALVRR